MVKIRIGISSCLSGHKIRFDGGRNFDDFINRHLAEFFEFVPLEPGCGMDVPRQPIRLPAGGDEIRAVGVGDPSFDFSAPLCAYFEQMTAQLQDICGYILTEAPPGCGMKRAKDDHPEGAPHSHDAGLCARALRQYRPLLPVEQEGRLSDPRLRENFITRVFVYHRWQGLTAEGLTPGRLVAFHSRHKLLLMAHNQAAYRRLGRWVAQAGAHDLATLAQTYAEQLMQALKRPATNKGHTNVLQHLMGYLKKNLDSGDKVELLETLDAYRRGELPLIVPITLLKHHFRRHPHPYVENQIYLSPHPAELMLRNSI